MKSSYLNFSVINVYIHAKILFTNAGVQNVQSSNLKSEGGGDFIETYGIDIDFGFNEFHNFYKEISLQIKRSTGQPSQIRSQHNMYCIPG